MATFVISYSGLFEDEKYNHTDGRHAMRTVQNEVLGDHKLNEVKDEKEVYTSKSFLKSLIQKIFK
ncbi:hypothetical protein EV200_1135 [Pedobacter psychrotolerans]|uniref:Uncharacterized protein n=1 Tax=Pedobacter psychrotolerans TaxID=1843235 RepID=A0A4R2H0E7_9SPHI|nr:hypothetical protein [Pedobacter psychrotolerans]TCO17733.1 hypothetical protein EV200_1135 [Pedobacter psychrotolerans]GGE71256.1 hypothetical protein GCM10011413_42540 [Pedobacter psychrotolerans]